ncbi:MAG: hypothetical protein KAR11_00255 [Phycisphaerae bacterium]|nr:hypothetical protein [Phycisphaerae bacterium]
MEVRPHILSKISMDTFTLLGYSVGGEESVVVAPELDVCFDIGRCPHAALTANNVLLTHGHTDHSVGLVYYFAQRDFQGIEGGKAIVPKRLVDPLENLIRAWGRVDGQIPPYHLIPVTDGDDYEIRRGLIARCFATKHVPGSLGFSVIDVRHKLKSEFTELTGPELVEQKKKGVEITNRIEVPLVAYLGDTAADNYSDLPCVRAAKALLVECTFYEKDHLDRARAGRHVHIKDLPKILEGMNNERIIITHVTRRTHIGAAAKMVRKILPAELQEKTCFLMSREFAPKNDE